MDEILISCTELLIYCTTWFFDMLDAMGFKPVYFGYVFVSMATGFLLRRFGSALSLGSDRAANNSNRKGDK